MPRFDKIIFEQTAHIFTPVSEQIIERFLKYIGIYDFFTNNIFFASAVQQTYADVGDDFRPKINIDRCDVLVEPNYNPKEAEWDAFVSKHHTQEGMPNNFFNRNYPIFFDKANRISIHQLSIPSSVKLIFSLKFKNIEKADYAASALYHKIMHTSVFNYTDVVYTYPIPDIIFMSLYHFYKMQELDPAEISFKDYLEFGSNSVFGTIANRNDQTIRQNVALQNSANVICNARYSGEKPDAEKKGKITSRHIVDFELLFQFSRPTALTIDYPYMINNKPIPKQLIPNSFQMQNENVASFNSEIALNMMIANHNEHCNPDVKYPLIQYPDVGKNVISTRTLSGVEKNYRPIFVGILQVDENTNSIVIDLESMIFPLLPEHVANEIRSAVISDENDELLLFLGLFNMTIIKNDNWPISNERIMIDRVNKTISVTTHVDSKAEYKLIINQVKSFEKLQRRSIDKILENYEYWDIVIYHNLNYLVKHGFITYVKETKQFVRNALPASQANQVNNVHFYRNRFKIFDVTITINK